MDLLINDVLSYLFSTMKPDVKYFRINKRIYELRKQYMMMHMKYNIQTYNNAHLKDVTIKCLLMYYEHKLKNDIGHYRKYILEFIANKKRKTTIYACVNSYHRLLVHRFCDSQGLLHETINKGTKKRYVCKKCNSVNILISSDYDDYHCYCKDCKNNQRCYADSDYLALDKLLINTSLPQKVIKITKF